MNIWMSVILIVVAAIGSSIFTYLLTRLRMERAAVQQAAALAEAVAALENEKSKFEQAARGNRGKRKTQGS